MRLWAFVGVYYNYIYDGIVARCRKVSQCPWIHKYRHGEHVRRHCITSLQQYVDQYYVTYTITVDAIVDYAMRDNDDVTRHVFARSELVTHEILTIVTDRRRPRMYDTL